MANEKSVFSYEMEKIMRPEIQTRIIKVLAEELRNYRDDLSDAEDYRGVADKEREDALLCACCIWLAQHCPGQLHDAIWAAALPEWSA